MKVCIKSPKSEVNQEQLEVISSFIKFLQSQLPLSSDVEVNLTGNQSTTGTTGVRMPGSKMYILANGRMLIDILNCFKQNYK